jgi:hypothetical protein
VTLTLGTGDGQEQITCMYCTVFQKHSRATQTSSSSFTLLLVPAHAIFTHASYRVCCTEAVSCPCQSSTSDVAELVLGSHSATGNDESEVEDVTVNSTISIKGPSEDLADHCAA